MRLAAAITLVLLAFAAVACGSSSGGLLSGGKPSSSAASPQSRAGSSTSATTPVATTNPAGAGSSVALDPCKILTKADAEATLGKPVNDPKSADTSTNPLGQKLCFYSAANATPASSVQVSLITTSGLTDQMKKTGWSARQQYDSEKKLSASTPVAGLGSDAFIRGPNLYVLKGDTDMSIQLFNGTPGSPEHTDALRALGAKLVPRLP